MNTELITKLRALADRQQGLFSDRQAHAAAAALGQGLSRRALESACERGWLRGIRRGVRAFVGYPPSRWELIVAAALAAGPDAVISHNAAAAVHGFRGIAMPTPELTVIGSKGRSLSQTRVHYSSAQLPAEDVQTWSGVAITSPIRTLADIIRSTEQDYLLGKIIDEGTISRLWTPERIDQRIAQLDGPGWHSCKRLRALLQPRLGKGDSDTVLEQRVIAVLDGMVPTFKVHLMVVLGRQVIEMDIAWQEHRIDGEADGRTVRLGSRSKFDSDRLRSNLLPRHGWREVHFTSTMSDRTILAQVVPLFPRDAIARDVWAEIVEE